MVAGKKEGDKEVITPSIDCDHMKELSVYKALKKLQGVNNLGQKIIPLMSESEFMYSGGLDLSFVIDEESGEASLVKDVQKERFMRNMELLAEETMTRENPVTAEYIMKRIEAYISTLPLAVRTKNGIVISHSGPVREIESLDVLDEVVLPHEARTRDDFNTLSKKVLSEVLYRDYSNAKHRASEEELKRYLKVADAGLIITGHNHSVDGISHQDAFIDVDDQFVAKMVTLVNISAVRNRKPFLLLELSPNEKDYRAHQEIFDILDSAYLIKNGRTKILKILITIN